MTRGSDHGVSYVVMALLEGETLRVRLQGPSAPTTAGSGKTPKPRSSSGVRGDSGPRRRRPDYRQGLTRVPASGGTPAEVLPALGGNTSWFSPVWLPDGKRFLVVRFSYADAAAVADVSPDGREAVLQIIGAASMQLVSVTLDGESPPRPIGSAQPGASQAALSPDGRWIAHLAAEGNTRRLFVQPLDGQGARIPVTAAAALYPRWRSDGRELYFLNDGGDGKIGVMAVPVTWAANGPDFGQPLLLFKIERLVLANLAFDVTDDGQRFVGIVANTLDASPITVRLRLTR